MDAIHDRHILELIRIYALQAADVKTELLGIGAPLVMGVDATDGAKKMLGGESVELIEL